MSLYPPLISAAVQAWQVRQLPVSHLERQQQRCHEGVSKRR
jgi:hypothetical protein